MQTLHHLSESVAPLDGDYPLKPFSLRCDQWKLGPILNGPDTVSSSILHEPRSQLCIDVLQ